MWRKIIGMRQIPVHNFHKIDNDELWDTARNDVPVLISQLETALNQSPG